MDTQEIDQTIKRACRNTIGDAVRRSAARHPEKDAIIFGGRRWSYAELDAEANRVARALLAQGLEQRVKHSGKAAATNNSKFLIPDSKFPILL